MWTTRFYKVMSCSIPTEADVSQELHNWLAETKKWQQQPFTIKLLYEEASRGDHLARFLQNLREALTIIGSVDDAVSKLPDVGQLLGRLTTIDGVLCHPRAYRALLRCILFFLVDKPQTPVETRAATWAVSQIRSTMCHPADSPSTYLLEATGITQDSFNTALIKKTVQNLFQDTLRPTHGDEQRQKPYLEDLCHLCLVLWEVPYFGQVLEQLVTAAESLPDSDMIPICQIITATQKDAYIDGASVPAISYITQVTVWRRHLPGLEQEVLQLVSACSKLATAAAPVISSLLSARHLAQACSECAALHQTVFKILYCLYKETGGSTRLGRLMSILHAAVREHCLSARSKSCLPIRSLAPREYRQLAVIMEIQPNALHQVACEHQLTLLSEQLQQMNEQVRKGDPSLEELLLKYQQWADASLLMALFGSRQIVPHCCFLLTVFHCCLDVPQIKQEQLLSLVLALRALLTKSHVQWDDVKCALAANDEGCILNEDDVTSIITGQLLMVFVTHSIGGSAVAVDALNLLMPDEDAVNHMLCLLDTISCTAPFWQENLHLAPLRIPPLLELINSLQAQAAAVYRAAESMDSPTTVPDMDLEPADANVDQSTANMLRPSWLQLEKALIDTKTILESLLKETPPR